VLVLIAFSPLEFDSEVANQAPAKKTTISKEQAEENERDFRKMISFVLFFAFVFVCIIVFIGIPEIRQKRLQRELEEAASTRGQQVLEELLAEVRLLRLAVENGNR